MSVASSSLFTSPPFSCVHLRTVHPPPVLLPKGIEHVYKSLNCTGCDFHSFFRNSFGDEPGFPHRSFGHPFSKRLASSSCHFDFNLLSRSLCVSMALQNAAEDC